MMLTTLAARSPTNTAALLLLFPTRRRDLSKYVCFSSGQIPRSNKLSRCIEYEKYNCEILLILINIYYKKCFKMFRLVTLLFVEKQKYFIKIKCKESQRNYEFVQKYQNSFFSFRNILEKSQQTSCFNIFLVRNSVIFRKRKIFH